MTVWDMVKKTLKIQADNPNLSKVEQVLLDEFKRTVILGTEPSLPARRVAARYGIIEFKE